VASLEGWSVTITQHPHFARSNSNHYGNSEPVRQNKNRVHRCIHHPLHENVKLNQKKHEIILKYAWHSQSPFLRWFTHGVCEKKIAVLNMLFKKHVDFTPLLMVIRQFY
jgi:N-formylglutamate amidohydrolase